MKKFFIPEWNFPSLIRLVVIGLVAFLFFAYLCIPAKIDGKSMLPTYPEHGFLFCWTPAYWFSEAKRGDVVMLSYGGRKVYLLKRILAVENDTIEFRDGICYVNGEALEEPYVVYRSKTWNLPLKIVAEGAVYVMGDNRGMPLENHIGGEIERSQIKGKALW